MNGFFFTPMKISELMRPTKDGYFYRMSDRYWPVTDNGEVLFYGTRRSPYGSPKCNANKAIAERFRAHLKGFVIVDILLIGVAFQPINMSDYYDH